LAIVAPVKMFRGLAKGLLNGSVKMKAIMILGANVGFVLGLGASILGDCSGPVALWHASATALVGGLLGRWWGKIFFDGFTDALEQRRREHAAAAAEKKSPVKV
jgi:flagellar motor component MotA